MQKVLLMSEVAERLNTSPDTLRYWRHIGQGPRSFKLGRRVAYFEDDVAAWLEDQAREAS